jgi:hypothetical protein
MVANGSCGGMTLQFSAAAIGDTLQNGCLPSEILAGGPDLAGCRGAALLHVEALAPLVQALKDGVA